MDDFWIGDWVRDEVDNVFGTFEGSKDGMARVKIGGVIKNIPESRLILLSDKEVEAIRLNQMSSSDKKSEVKEDQNISFTDKLDLHIEKLAPHLANRQVELILKKQIDATREFIDKAIAKRQLCITIIHGKGTGALKMEVLHLLEDYEEVYFTKTSNNGGAVEVLFSYVG